MQRITETGFPGLWPRHDIKIKLFIILVSEKSSIYDNSSCRARAGKPEDDDITTLITFHKDLFIIPIYNEKLFA